MSADRIGRATDVLRSEYEELRECVTFLSFATSLRPRLGELLNWSTMDGPAKSLAQSFMRQREESVGGALRGLFVSAAASYEQFVRDLVQACAELVAARASSFDSLDEYFRKQHMSLTGRALGTVLSPKRHQKFDYTSLARNLGSCVPGSSEFAINSSVFAADITTPDTEGLEKALDRVGVRAFWDAVGRDTAVQKAVRSTATRESANLARRFLEDFVDRRNLIAHAGRSAVSVVETDLSDVLDVVPAICAAIAAHAAEVLSRGR